MAEHSATLLNPPHVGGRTLANRGPAAMVPSADSFSDWLAADYLAHGAAKALFELGVAFLRGVGAEPSRRLQEEVDALRAEATRLYEAALSHGRAIATS